MRRRPARKRSSSHPLFNPAQAARFGLFAMILLLMGAGTTAGYLKANSTLREREARIATQMARFVDGMVRQAQGRQAQLASLLDQPCSAVFGKLSALGTFAPYTRVVDLVKDGTVYCSSGAGALDVPLSDYLPVSDAPQQVALIPRTPLHPLEPALVVYNRQGRGGVLYVIEGLYLSDLLSQGVAYGAGSVELTVPGYGRLTQDGKFLPEHGLQNQSRVSATSEIAPFTIAVTAGEQWVARDRLRWESIGAGVGLLLSALCVFGYHLVYGHSRSLLRAAAHGLRRGEFHVVYQPIVNVATREWKGVEALVRWTHPKWGEIGPNAFIKEVEESALIGPLTNFVLRTAFRELGEAGLPRSLHLAINIAPRHIERRTFVDEIVAAIAASPYAFPLVLEITERGLLDNSDAVKSAFSVLKARGIQFAIDDFGTEHSNIDLLRRFEFNFFKIDRQFVNRATSGGASLLAGISSLARHLGTALIAEGVEDETQHAAIAKIGIDCAQGYLYEKPLRVQALAAAHRGISETRSSEDPASPSYPPATSADAWRHSLRLVRQARSPRAQAA